jgi:hypothetical protein
MLLLRERRAQAAVLLILQTCKSGLALLSPQSLVGEPDVEAVVAKPQEDGAGCPHLSCKSSAFGHEARSSLLVEKALTTCSLLVEKPLMTDGLLAFVGGTLVKESLATIGLLALTSSFLVEMALVGCRLEAMALIDPQGVDRPLPIQVGTFCVGASPKKDGPPGWVRRQYPSSLFIFSKGSLKPFFVTKGMTNIGRGIEFLINIEQSGARGGGCDHLYCSHAKGSEREDKGK